ncbi:MAG TPA: branched-chain amino acid ABC transporter permease, partial [Tepidiformaceae bacterium]|nr:branched-chain amino acid ABC transporter permease [Tepidiformaceae bacterium]
MPVVFLASTGFWWDQFINGLTTGSLYALIALGYTMVYGVLQMINFAHGEVFMLGSFAGYGVLSAMGGDEISGTFVAFAILIAIIGAMAASVGTSLALERIAYRPLRNAPRLAPLISAIGASIFLQYLVLDRTDAGVRIYPSIFPTGSFGVGSFDIQYIQAFLIAASVAMMLFLYAIVQRTRTGRAIRAVAENPTNAALMGVDV